MDSAWAAGGKQSGGAVGLSSAWDRDWTVSEDQGQSSASTRGSGQSVSVIISDGTARWLAVFIVGMIAVYGAVKASTAYNMAQHSDMNYTLVYSHQIKEEAYLSARGAPVDTFGTLPPPKGNKP